MTPAERRRLMRLNTLSRAERAAELNPQTPTETLSAIGNAIRDDRPDAVIKHGGSQDRPSLAVGLPGTGNYLVIIDPDGKAVATHEGH